VTHHGSGKYRISIHAPRAGSDEGGQVITWTVQDFNPRPPSGERRDGVFSGSGVITFQSTPPERGATNLFPIRFTNFYYFNPRPPSGERHAVNGLISHLSIFQSTPPERGATFPVKAKKLHWVFQSTPPERGATALLVDPRHHRIISIHAPRAGSDKR